MYEKPSDTGLDRFLEHAQVALTTTYASTCVSAYPSHAIMVEDMDIDKGKAVAGDGPSTSGKNFDLPWVCSEALRLISG